MRKLLEKILKVLSVAVLKKQKPQIVTITGSIGKTSVKEAVFFALKQNLAVRTNIKSYNNEIGVPLTIIGETSPGKNIFGWAIIFLKALGLACFKSKAYPKILVLEIGADKKGDLKYLMDILKFGNLKVAVLTAVSPAHLEALGTLRDVYNEKCVPFTYLKQGAFAVIANDDVNIEKVKSFIPQGVQVVTYGILNKANVFAQNIVVNERGVECNILANGREEEFALKDGVAKHQLYSVLAGVACGVVFSLGLQTTLKAIAFYEMPNGRLKKIAGINNSLLLDDTYNASPKATKSALGALSNLNFGKRKIAVLGDMLELGSDSKKYHKEIIEFAKNLKLDFLVTFGENFAGISSDKHFLNHQEASSFLASLIKDGDVVLLKGSQGVRIEKLTKALMARPEQAKNMLVRQESTWLKK